MAYRDTVQISIYGPVAVIEDLYKAQSAQVKAERTKRDDGWWVIFDDMLMTSIEDKDIPAGFSDPQTHVRERLVRFVDPREKGHEFGPACIVVSGDILRDGGERLTGWLRTLTRQYPVSALAHLMIEYHGQSVTLFHGTTEHTLYDIYWNPKTKAQEFSAQTGDRYQTLVSEKFEHASQES